MKNEKDSVLLSKLKTAFQEASDFLELKKQVDISIKKISRMLEEMTDNVMHLKSSEGSLDNFTTNYLINIERVDDYRGLNSLFLCGYRMDEIKGFPVIIETYDEIISYETADTFEERIVELISSPECTMRILELANNSAFDDIPF